MEHPKFFPPSHTSYLPALQARSFQASFFLYADNNPARSRALPNGRLLEEVRDGNDPQREAGSQRGDVCAELRREVSGCELHGY